MHLRLHLDQLLVVRGMLTITGRQPDGDSLRFIPDNPSILWNMPHASRLRFAKDGSVQLRMDGIDAPETHFAGQAQPYGVQARAQFLELIGFKAVTYNETGTVVGSNPAKIAATILVNTLDPYGRPVAYLIPGRPRALQDGQLQLVGPAILESTVNVAMLRAGAAYITLYNSSPLLHRDALRTAASAAKKARKGVWALDATNQFILEGLESIGPEGTLILPKLFRRAVHYVQATEAGFSGSFPHWIEGTAAHVYHSEDDAVMRANGKMQHLHQIISQQGTVVMNNLDPIGDIFIEQ